MKTSSFLFFILLHSCVSKPRKCSERRTFSEEGKDEGERRRDKGREMDGQGEFHRQGHQLGITSRILGRANQKGRMKRKEWNVVIYNEK